MNCRRFGEVMLQTQPKISAFTPSVVAQGPPHERATRTHDVRPPKSACVNGSSVLHFFPYAVDMNEVSSIDGMCHCRVEAPMPAQLPEARADLDYSDAGCSKGLRPCRIRFGARHCAEHGHVEACFPLRFAHPLDRGTRPAHIGIERRYDM
jgi:hypothetical protein